MRRFLVHLFLLLSLASPVTLAACVTPIYQYGDDTFIENLLTLPSGNILLSTFGTGNLFFINPNARNPTPRYVAKLGTTTGLTAIAELPGNLFAIGAGVHTEFGFANNSMALFVVKVTGNPPTGAVVASIPVLGTSMMNGLAALPNRPFTVLSADSITGRLLRINTLTHDVDVAWTDPAIGSGGNMDIPLGINGLKIKGNWLYFTNSGRGTFARVPIDDNGNKVGGVQVIATLPQPANMFNAFDDFDFDDCDNAYVALHASSVVKITPGGVQTIVASGLKSPTSVARADDGDFMYISTGGDFAGPVITGGGVLKLKLRDNC